MSDGSPGVPSSHLKLGTFLGVFTPTVLTILGVIMYLRIGWVVGTAGLWGAILIILVSNAITLITALSMSTLATSMRVGVGGAYFLISRSFGLEIGGAIGIPLYLSQVLSLTLYAYGLAESMRIVLPGLPGWSLQVIAGVIVVGVTMIAARSTELTLKLQVPILALIAASLLSLVMGIDFGTVRVDAWGPWTEDAGFWQVFAVFFPAVTGVLTGLSLSGDLEDPSESIPRGVLWAVGVGAVVYLALPVALAMTASASELTTNSLIWTEVAYFGWLVVPGMWGAVLSSAFGSILSAPRTLQALAGDRLAPAALAENDPETGEPLLGLRLSGGLALIGVILLPDLNAVASWVTVFFLTTYGALNLAAFLEIVIGDPAFRPRIRVPWWASLLGAAGCILAMSLINPVACVVALLIETGIFFALSRRSLEATWGDARSGLLLTGARYALMSLRESRFDPRNWRPHILVFTTDLPRDIGLVKVADDFGQHRGIVTLVRLIVGDLDEVTNARALLQEDERTLRAAGLGAFPEVSVVPDEEQGVLTVAQANGFAGIQSNTVLFGLRRSETAQVDLARLLVLARKLEQLDKCTVIFRPSGDPEARPPGERSIVIWWAGRQNNGDLMLLLAHLLTVSVDWRSAKIQLKSIVNDADGAAERRRELATMIPEFRIDVDVDVIQRAPGSDTHALIRAHSKVADFVFLGMDTPEAGEEELYAARLLSLLEGLPSTLLVRNAGEFRGRLV
jgi:amino acid transporter